MREDRKLPRTKSVIRVDEIVEICRGKDVLNIGMGGWTDDMAKGDAYLTPKALEDSVHYRLSKVANSLVGTDIIQDSLDRMERLVPGKYVQADLTAPGLAERFDDRFEIVVFAEVIEHLDDFRTALQNIREVLRPGGAMLLTTANAYSADRIAKMLFNYEACHEEHTSYFSYVTLRRLLAMNDFSIRHFSFHNEKPFNSVKRSQHFLYYGMRALTRFMPQFSEGILLVAEPKQAEHDSEAG